MFGFGRKQEVDLLMKNTAAETIRSWSIYVKSYESLNSVGKKEVSIYMEKVFEDISTTHPNLFQMEAMKYIQLLENYNNIFGRLFKQDKYMGLAGHMFITFLYAKGFCAPSEVNEIGSKIQQIKNMGK